MNKIDFAGFNQFSFAGFYAVFMLIPLEGAPHIKTRAVNR